MKVAVCAASCSMHEKIVNALLLLYERHFFFLYWHCFGKLVKRPDTLASRKSKFWSALLSNVTLFISCLSQMISVANCTGCTSVKLSGCCHKCEWIHCDSVVPVPNEACKFPFSFMLFFLIYYEGFTCSMHLHAYNKHCSLAVGHIIYCFLKNLYVFSHL